MITWMQRHKKYLIITIWISTIAFVGAGFVGWGQYSYGDKAGAVAKVGQEEISMGELQQAYSTLYNQYNQMFQGNFDEERAKSFGLEKQALSQLINQALLLNLAKSYDLQVSDKEVLELIKTKEYFFDKGVFDKEVYKQVLSRNNLTMKEYEEDVRKQLLLQKTLQLLPVAKNKNEEEILSVLFSIADKINYKILDDKEISVETTDEKLKPYWEQHKNSFMTQTSYEISYIRHPKHNETFDQETIKAYYNDNKSSFKDAEGKIVSFEDAMDRVVAALHEDAAKKEALRTYIDFKKGELKEGVAVQTQTISAQNNPFNAQLLEGVAQLSTVAPYMKPLLVDGEYITVKLLAIHPSEPKSFELAKEELLPLYIQEQKRAQLLELAKNSYKTFQGKTSEFISAKDSDKIADLTQTEASEFLAQLFTKKAKQGYIELSEGKIVLYNILEQKLLDNTPGDESATLYKMKSALFQEGLLKHLNQKYTTEIFIEGL